MNRRDAMKTGLMAVAGAMTNTSATRSPRHSSPGSNTARSRRAAPRINVLRGGRGAPLLLIHGLPQTHAEWHKIAGKLAERFTVVMVDLRGYGDSSTPADGENHTPTTRSARWRSTRSR
jgi:haloacetate dehalogenase